MRNLTVAFITVLLLAHCGGLSNTDKKNAAAGDTKTIQCKGHTPILTKNEKFNVDYSGNGIGSYSAEVDPGPTLSYLDWGTLEKLSPTVSVYTAPAYIPETRKVFAAVSQDGNSSFSGQCPIQLFDDGTLSVADDGNLKGLVGSAYTATAIASIPDKPLQTLVVRELNFSGVSTPLITNATGSIVVKFTGTIDVGSGGNYWFRVGNDNGAELTIDGTKQGTLTTTGEIPLTTTPAYATGIALSGGKHKIEIAFLDSSAGTSTFKLEWLTTKPTTASKPYTVIPAAAFDRD